VNGYEEFNKLCALADKEKFPIKCTFELTYKCNLRCCHCYVSGEKAREELSKDQIISIMDQLFDMGTRYICFTGGEVFTRTDVWKILEHATELNLKIDIKTNATLIEDEAADRLQSLNPTMIEVSMYGVTKKVFEAVTRKSGSFEAFVEGIHQLHKVQIPLMFIYTPTKLNWQEGRQVKAFAYDMGQKFRLNPYITPLSPNKRENLKYRLGPERMAEVMLEINRRRNGRKPRSLFIKYPKGQIFAFDIGISHIIINPYGEMRPCIEIYEPSYNLAMIPVKEAWKNMVDHIAGYKPGEHYQCSGCHLREVCLQCPGHSYLETGDMNNCVPYLKRAAKWVKEKRGDINDLKVF
jgi:radical SAM protein with 4Fe4S-binding SPASM domain